MTAFPPVINQMICLYFIILMHWLRFGCQANGFSDWSSNPERGSTYYLFNEFHHTNRTVDEQGAVLKKRVSALRRTANRQVELVFLVDGSSSVLEENFTNELKFIRKLVADFTVDENTTRIAVITFGTRTQVVRQIDHLTRPGHHKCSLLEEELPSIQYTGGATYTKGAVLEAQVKYT